MYDLKIIANGKERFKDLYAKSLEDRQKLRETDGYRQCLLDLTELVAASVVFPQGIRAFFETVTKMILGELKIMKNIDDN
jgi:hypothetical protein